jgi:hypothetical protein
VTGSVLAALVLGLAAANPPRRALPLAAAAPPVRAAGAALAAVALLLVALGAGAIADALEVSVPTVLIAAGLVVGATSLAEVLMAAPPPLPDAEAAGAWACPVAFPHLLRPQLALAALAAGVAHGALVGAVVAVGGPLLAVVVAGLGGGAARPGALGAAGRFAGALGVLAAVDAVLDGIFAV